ncbi:synaptic vesicle glycoprotein 2C-like [Sipha flava]|uniref:Synaptic vesicle glycoprotein 2A n=1 Tax=Sipha flava TaxID=143950 RepID=A0A2S2QJC6_9HEMI|nr:synaptic vesicle glycoprotein 2C-like [Sipha flava]
MDHRTVPSLDFLDNNSVLEHAITCAGFGKFHFSLLALCGLIIMNGSTSVGVLSFILPSAQCDFSMSSSYKGLLNAIPSVGMLFGAYFWGSLADVNGRKITLIESLLMDGLFSIASSFLTFYWPFLICRFFSGFGISGYLGICYSYLGEFLPKIYRGKVLSCLEMFWTAGIILAPLVAWGIIPLSADFAFGAFRYSSWNMFLTLCSLPSFLLPLWLTRFPESPKFLMEHGDFDEALDCLRHIYTLNTGKPGHEYPLKSLVNNGTMYTGIGELSEMSLNQSKTKISMDLKDLATKMWCQTKELFKPPHLRNTVLTCLIQFGLTSSYYALAMWLPELFNRFEKFETEHPDMNASMCQVSSVYIEQGGALNTTDLCGSAIGESVYTHTLWIGIACIPSSLLMPLCVHRLGAKFFLVMSLLMSSVAAAALYFVKNSLQNLILSCIYEAFCGLGINALLCIGVDLFPTNIRVMAAAASTTVGRLGSLFANIIFGLLIDSHCFLLIIIFSSLLLLSSFLALALPRGDSKNLDKLDHA